MAIQIQAEPQLHSVKTPVKPPAKFEVKTKKGLSEGTVREISAIKQEPDWMLQKRLKSYEIFLSKPMPAWGVDLSEIDFNDLTYYVSPDKKKTGDWEKIPKYIKKTFDKLGIPEAERKFLSGAGAQYDSEVLYRNIRSELSDLGVIYTDTDTAVREYPELVKKYFMTNCVPSADNKFAALHGAVWSGGSFVYVPKGVTVPTPLQIYFLMNYQSYGQFEHTLIVAEEGSNVQYIEGCFTKGAPIVTKDGIKPIEEVKEGDFVFTHKNRFKRVYHTQVRPYSGNLNAISYYGDSTQKIEVTDEHPFLAVRKERDEYTNNNWEGEWIEAKNLSKGDYLCIPIDKEVEAKEFREFSYKFGRGRHGFKQEKMILRTDEDFFRLVGYYLAEGTVLSEHYLSFTFNVKEREYIEDVKTLLATYFGKNAIEYPAYNNGISLILCSTPAARVFQQLFGKTAFTKSVPEWVMKESFEKQMQLVKGYFRGDGSYMNKRFKSGLKNIIRINSISRKLAEQVRQMLFRNQIFAGLNKWKKKGVRKDSYAIHVGGSQLVKFAEKIGLTQAIVDNGRVLQSMKIGRRVSYSHIDENYAYVQIKSIEKTNADNIPVYNFGVEDDESYVASGAAVHNCSAPHYSTYSLHSAVVEIFAKKDSRVRYTSIQNWSKNVYNLNTKRAIVGENAVMEWIGATLGSKKTMLYPCSILSGRGARADHINIAFATDGQEKDGGAKVYHAAPDTSSTIVAKSLCQGKGIATYRGLVKINKGATGCKTAVRCDAMLLDKKARTKTYPYMEVLENDATVAHEATVGRIDEDSLFYLQSRGLSENEAKALIVSGFIEPVTKLLPLEYAVELNRLIELEMTGPGAVG